MRDTMWLAGWLLVVSCQSSTEGTARPSLTQQQASLTIATRQLQSLDPTAKDYLGWSVALSADAKTALVGAYGKGDQGLESGAAYVFERSGDGWAQGQKLLPDDVLQGSRFGEAVALSTDGNLAFVGAPGKSSPDLGPGAVYVFSRNGGVWTQQQLIVSPAQKMAGRFGGTLAFSADRTTLLVGDPGKHSGNLFDLRGEAYAFIQSGGQWVAQQALGPDDLGNGDSFGAALALSADGSTALIGAPSKTVTDGMFAGAAYVFVRSGSTWSQQTRLAKAVPGFSSDRFGASAALSADGHLALVGVTGESSEVAAHGAVMTFVRQGSSWSQQATITAATKVASEAFGSAVAVTPDGARAVIGARTAFSSGSGSAYLFANSSGTWSPLAQLLPEGATVADQAGHSVALSPGGAVALVGVPRSEFSGNPTGAAFSFELQSQAGEPCSDGAQCTSGQCQGGVCCEDCGAGGSSGSSGQGGSGAGQAGVAGVGGSGVAGQGGGAAQAGSGGVGPGAGGAGSASGGQAGQAGKGATAGAGGGVAGKSGAGGQGGPASGGQAGRGGPAAEATGDEGGCGCRAAGATGESRTAEAWLLLSLLVTAVRARRLAPRLVTEPSSPGRPSESRSQD